MKNNSIKGLNLNKETIADLSITEMNEVNGGNITVEIQGTDACCPPETQNVTCDPPPTQGKG